MPLGGSSSGARPQSGGAPIGGGTRSSAVLASSTMYWGPSGGDQTGTTAETSHAYMVMPSAGTLSNLRSRLGTLLGAAETIVLTVRVNGADTALTITHPNNGAAGSVVSNTASTVSVSAGDLVSVKTVSTDTAANGVSWGMEFAP